MKFYIDTDQCKKLKVPVALALYIASLYYDEFIGIETFQEACSRGMIEFDGFEMKSNSRQPINPRLTQTGVDLVETIFLNSEFRNPNTFSDRFDSLADKLREIYPKGRKDNTPYTWRDSTAIISKKLKALIKRTGASFTDEEAIEATTKYVASFNGNYQYMKLLKYFISKIEERRDSEGNIVREETSELLNYIANAKDLDVTNSQSDNGRLA